MRTLSFFFILSLVFAFSLCEAAVVSPDLQAVLQTASSGQEIPVIINLADRVDVNQISIAPASHTQEGKKYKRDKIAEALKDKANKTRGALMG